MHNLFQEISHACFWPTEAVDFRCISRLISVYTTFQRTARSLAAGSIAIKFAGETSAYLDKAALRCASRTWPEKAPVKPFLKFLRHGTSHENDESEQHGCEIATAGGQKKENCEEALPR